ncbi:UPF0496 protein 3-like [Ananas comosus]|uniref:UPF0496 protein 3-like n=1 Tax=Ananas comosus TaxID=4615 RepID=A0A6P5EGY4_ANACO|nr:UPF0496 protein 3-like [Ananas comosus]
MCMKFNIFSSCKHQANKKVDGVVIPIASTSFNLREEYASAFRTESYNEFWARVLDLTLDHGAALKPSHESSSSSSSSSSTAAARLPSYRLFAEHLLDPDQATITEILADARKHCHPEVHFLLSEYYSETANASLLFSLILKDIERIRARYRPFKAVLRSLVSDNPPPQHSIQAIDKYLAEVSKTFNPFHFLASSQRQFRMVQGGSADLLKQLEASRKKAKAKLRLVNWLKRAFGFSLIIITASTAVIGALIVVHALMALVALPALLPVTMSSRVGRAVAQLDVAAKGTYILNRDLDTVSRLVARLQDEVEHVATLLRMCEEERRRVRRGRLVQEVVREVQRKDVSFRKQLDELEEHLYLCFMTINRARRMVMTEVLCVK